MTKFKDINKLSTEEVSKNISMNIQSFIWDLYAKLLQEKYYKDREDVLLTLERNSPLSVNSKNKLNDSEFMITFRSERFEDREFIISDFSKELKKIEYQLKIITHEESLITVEADQDLLEYGIVRG